MKIFNFSAFYSINGAMMYSKGLSKASLRTKTSVMTKGRLSGREKLFGFGFRERTNNVVINVRYVVELSC